MRLLQILLLSTAIGLFSCGDDSEEETRVDRFSLALNTFNESDANETQQLAITAEGVIADLVTATYRFVDDGAKDQIDYVGASGTITFEPGNTTATIPLEIVGDVDYELTEQLRLVVNYETVEAGFIITIKDNDQIAGTLERDNDGVFSPESYPSMDAVWSEEFNMAGLDESTWNYELGDGCDRGICGWGNQELQSYTDLEENVKLEEGKLIITATKVGANFESARITTQDKVEFAFGRIDIRAKLPKGQGIWPAIWMLGANINDPGIGWPKCGEIDIMELVGHEPEVAHGTVHYDNGGYQTSTGRYALTEGDFSDEFHVFTLAWDQDIMSWYIDNQLYRSFVRPANSSYPFNADFFFILNIAVGGLWPGNPDATTVFPQEMMIDYIRVFR